MYWIFRNAFEWALPMNAYPSMPIPISSISPTAATGGFAPIPVCSSLTVLLSVVASGALFCSTAAQRPVNAGYYEEAPPHDREENRFMKTSLGIWALGPMITRFVTVGYQPEDGTSRRPTRCTARSTGSAT